MSVKFICHKCQTVQEVPIQLGFMRKGYGGPKQDCVVVKCPQCGAENRVSLLRQDNAG
jgi:RNase P subunit RPR2